MIARAFPGLLLAGMLSFASHGAPPNILLLYADDLGYGDVGCYNPESKIPTPNIDRLAARGLRFTDAHSSSGICSPSRYALLTGRFHWRKMHGISLPFDPPSIGDDEITLPGLLKKAGYATALIGKWHLGWNWNWKDGRRPEEALIRKGGNSVATVDLFDFDRVITGGPMGAGFDEYFGQDVPNFPPYAWIENGRFVRRDLVTVSPGGLESPGWRGHIHGTGPGEPDWTFDRVMPALTRRAADHVRNRAPSDPPFFLMFSATSPHTPVVPERRFQGASGAGHYGDFVTQLDDEVGRILAVLEESGRAETTIVIFTSDNGPTHHTVDLLREPGHRSSGPLRGFKRDLYEGGHRVPFIVRWPGRTPEGAVSDALISQVDLFATLAAAAGVDVPADAAHDSHNLLPVWTSNAPSPRRAIVHNTVDGAYAVREDNWVLITAKSGSHNRPPAWFPQWEKTNGYATDEHPGELYDLGRDLAQKRNLYGEVPEKVRELTRRLDEIRARGQVR